jgi:hypothetical protein
VFLGRGRYQRAAPARTPARTPGRAPATGTGGTVSSAAGPVQLSQPKLRGGGAFASRLFGSHVTKTEALGSLVIASFVRRPCLRAS